MMKFIDISVKKFSGHFTHRAKQHNVGVKILLKCPREELTTVRLTGTADELGKFLELDAGMSEHAAGMHIAAIKNLSVADIAVPSWKNRGLSENRPIE